MLGKYFIHMYASIDYHHIIVPKLNFAFISLGFLPPILLYIQTQFINKLLFSWHIL
jgi:hypothetical protein